MSYNPIENEDSLSELFSRYFDFNLISPNLLDARKDFIVWFDKCIKIDKRATFLFLRQNKNKINSKNLEYAKNFFRGEI